MIATLKPPAHKPISVKAMLVDEFLKPLNISQGELAKAMGVGRKTVNELCVGKRGITVETAFLLAKVLQTTPGFWFNLQLINDMWTAINNRDINSRVERAKVLVGEAK